MGKVQTTDFATVDDSIDDEGVEQGALVSGVVAVTGIEFEGEV